ncbi:MAG: DUF559 domain-containing protein [Pseudomonadota bacterium]
MGVDAASEHNRALGVAFVRLDAGLIGEVDGSQHAEHIAPDRRRRLWLEQQDFRVLRCWNHEILQRMGAVQERTALALWPSPSQGEGTY